MFMCQICECFNINHLRIGVSQGFNIKSLGVVLNGCLNLFQVERVYEGSGYTEIYQGMC